jgi:GT2 family glycosyltransferase
MPLISAVVPTYSRFDLLCSCIDGLLGQTIGDLEVIIVDNASRIGISDGVQRRYGSKVIGVRLDRNLFFCGAVNHGARLASGHYLAVINDDCSVEAGWAEAAMATFAHYPDAAAVASLVLNADAPEVIDSAGDHLDMTGRATNLLWGQTVSEVELKITPVFSPAGSCAIYRRDLFDMAGMFDEDFVAYVDDVDLGFRMQLLGCPTIFNPQCRAYHTGGGTFKKRTYAAYLLERNMVWNLVKNLPTELLRRHLDRIVRANSVPAPIVGGTSLAGWIYGKAAGFAGMPRMLKKRREIQLRRRISIGALETLLLSRQVDHCHL